VRLELLRISSGEESTLGILYDRSDRGARKALAFTLEDEFRAVKVSRETRIPSGLYTVKLRLEGGLHAKYGRKYPEMHRGMLWLQDVPGFKWIYIHVGNKDDDTEGCILVGDTLQQNVTEDGFVGASRTAYSRIYPPIARAIAGGEGVSLQITDMA